MYVARLIIVHSPIAKCDIQIVNCRQGGRYKKSKLKLILLANTFVIQAKFLFE